MKYQKINKKATSAIAGVRSPLTKSLAFGNAIPVIFVENQINRIVIGKGV